MKVYKLAVGAAAAASLMIGSLAFAQTAPVLTVAATFPTSVVAGQQDATLATVSMVAAGGNPIAINSLRFGLAGSDILSDCRIRDAAGVALNNGANVPTPLSSTLFVLDTGASINSGSSATVRLTCDISAAAQNGNTIGVALLPGAVGAFVGTTTATVVGAGLGAGVPFSGELVVGGGAAPGTGSGTGGTPGVPNTGAGGDLPATLTLLALAALLAGFGIAGLRKIS